MQRRCKWAISDCKQTDDMDVHDVQITRESPNYRVGS
jgi:hypothetical protein